jgi:hypothetical protein
MTTITLQLRSDGTVHAPLTDVEAARRWAEKHDKGLRISVVHADGSENWTLISAKSSSELENRPVSG